MMNKLHTITTALHRFDAISSYADVAPDHDEYLF